MKNSYFPIILGLLVFSIPRIAFAQEANQHSAARIVTVARIAAGALTLRNCYQLALKQSEIIAIDAEKIKEAQARFAQSLGLILPQVSFVRTDSRQEAESSADSRHALDQEFVFTQTLFSGFKEFAAMSASRLQGQQLSWEKQRAEQLLYTDVADAFYLLLEIREDLGVLRSIHQSLEERVKDLQQRENIGKSRHSEVVNVQVQVYNIEADIETGKSQEVIARQLLEFLIGKPVKDIVDTDIDFQLKTEKEYLAKAEKRSDVRAARYAWQAQRKLVTVAQSGYFPKVSGEVDYFLHRSTAPQNNDWTALLTIDVPIFEGTTVYGEVRQAQSVAKQNEWLWLRAKRQAVQDIQTAYANVQADLGRNQALAKALAAAEENYSLQLQDYKYNLVNNLTVLDAIQSLETARRSYIHTTYESKRFYRQLLTAAGEE
ncbi:MAG: TolC family protein [Candidatus Omnitrophica bacterium]|nr:TolC family protein [Candidatus Omnitrophota bacterium]